MLGREHIQHLHNRASNLGRKLDLLRGRLANSTKKFVATAETAMAAAAGGVIQGRAGQEGSHVLGIPTDAGLGIVLNLLGYFDAAGDYSDHLNNLGNGFLSSFTSSVGFGWGNAWRETGKFSLSAQGRPSLPTGPAVKGEIPAAQMADIVARVRAAAGHH